MATLAIMKARILSELRNRSDLVTPIASAISTAVSAYQEQRFYFNESRSMTFSTVANQEFYTSTDDANIGLIKKIDYVKLYVGDYPYGLAPEVPEEIERLSLNGTTTGQPLVYCYYARSFRINPVPETVYTIRVGGQIKLSEPASDSEVNNAWMIDGERLIRSRAKYEIALHVLRDSKLAEEMASSIQEAEAQLRRDTAQQTQQGGWLITPTRF